MATGHTIVDEKISSDIYCMLGQEPPDFITVMTIVITFLENIVLGKTNLGGLAPWFLNVSYYTTIEIPFSKPF